MTTPRKQRPTTGTPAASSPKTGNGRWFWLGAGVLAVSGAALLYFRQPPAEVAGPAEYSGSASCASCHQEQHQAWQHSQHAAAIQEATERSVLGNFNDALFTHAGVTTRFFRRDGRFVVHTEGPDGRTRDYEVAYTFGVFPLQQYLIPFPGGRFQALGIAWDARPDSAGGQRWFHLYPGNTPAPGDPLHWTGIDQVWNYQCAECHSTNLRKGYNPPADTYATTWSELAVGCEACHGPASRHLEWASTADEARRGEAKQGESGYPERAMGLTAVLRDSAASTWVMDSATGIARRSTLPISHHEIETCARCHARRGVLSEDYLPGRSVTQTHRPALLDEGLYTPDGQMQDEVYTYGSFLQSRMYRAGVSCSDCHDPHGPELPGDAVCARCHLPARFEVPAHHRHAVGSRGSSCIACHMAARTYMVVDPRHDHGFKVPRPDLTSTLGTPNACLDCHRDRSAAWIAEAARQWYPSLADRPSFAPALALGRQGSLEGKAALERLIQDTSQPGVVRATAVGLVARYGGTTLATPLQVALWDADPLVRAAGTEALDRLDPALARQMALPLLNDSIRLVRITAARFLAGQAGSIDPAVRPRLDSVIAEVRAAELVNADRPEARLNLGNLAFDLGDVVGAEREYNEALRLDSSVVAASVNLAELYRAIGRDREAEPVLRRAMARAPEDAGVQHALGLLLVRRGQRDAALEHLGRAARLDPRNPRYVLVHGVALHDLGNPAEAIAVLTRGAQRHPGDRDLLLTLSSYYRETGDLRQALTYARQAGSLDPGDRETQRMLRELEAMHREQ